MKGGIIVIALFGLEDFGVGVGFGFGFGFEFVFVFGFFGDRVA